MKTKEELAIEYCKKYHHNRDNTKFFIAGWDARQEEVDELTEYIKELRHLLKN